MVTNETEALINSDNPCSFEQEKSSWQIRMKVFHCFPYGRTYLLLINDQINVLFTHDLLFEPSFFASFAIENTY